MQNKPTYHTKIPADIRFDKNLNANAKLLYGEITALCNAKGFCWASNAFFADLYNVSKRSIQIWLTQLEESGRIEVVIDKKAPKDSMRKIYIKTTQEAIQEVTQEAIPQQEEILTLTHEENFTHEKNFTHEEIFALTHEEIFTHEENYADPRKKFHGGHEKNFTPTHEKNFTLNNTSINNTRINKEINNNKNNILLISDETSKKVSQLEHEFEKLWKLYPRKQSKKKAFESYKKARKEKKIPYETIENGLYRYLRYIEQEDLDSQFIPHGSTWFNQHRWQDEYAVQARKKPKNHFEYLQMKYGGMNYEPNGNGEIIDDYSKVIPDPFQGL